MKLPIVGYAVLLALLLSGCSKPADTVIPTDMSTWDTTLAPAMKKLNDNERQMVAAYLLRAKMGEVFGGKGIPPGLTVGQAIEQQKAYLEEQKKKEAEAKALADKLRAEAAEARKQFEDAVTVTVVSMNVRPKDIHSYRFSDRHEMTLGFENKTDRDIAGLTGSVVFFDMFDKKVGDVSFKFEGGIKAHKTATWKGGRDINDFNKEHRALANLEPGKYTFKFEPEMIVFTDGTKLRMPEEK